MKASAYSLKPISNDMALNEGQQLILTVLAASPLSKRFYWTGGTLLTEKYLHHRDSYDIDLFSDDPFRYEEIIPIVKEIQRRHAGLRVEQQKIFDRWEFFLHNGQEIRLEFVWYAFPSLHQRKKWQGVMIDSLDDLAANKTMAVIDRFEPKDVVDIYGLMTECSFTIKKLLTLSNKKFGVEQSADILFGALLRGCRRLEQIRPMLFGQDTSGQVHTIQKHFERLSAEYLRRQWKK